MSVCPTAFMDVVILVFSVKMVGFLVCVYVNQNCNVECHVLKYCFCFCIHPIWLSKQTNHYFEAQRQYMLGMSVVLSVFHRRLIKFFKNTLVHVIQQTRTYRNEDTHLHQKYSLHD